MVGVRNHDAYTADTASPSPCVKLVACANPNPSLRHIGAEAHVLRAYASIKNTHLIWGKYKYKYKYRCMIK